MRFRLTYYGPLGSNKGPVEKQALRRAFHPQLEELWSQLPLREYRDLLVESPVAGKASLVFPLGAFRFVPLVSARLNLIARLQILFLRREEPGAIVTAGGDVDNRIKTLLDALRMPRAASEVPDGDTPQAEEEPFFCLLEDDALVTGLDIDTDRLLEKGDPAHVQLVIRVVTYATRASWANVGLSG